MTVRTTLWPRDRKTTEFQLLEEYYFDDSEKGQSLLYLEPQPSHCEKVISYLYKYWSGNISYLNTSSLTLLDSPYHCSLWDWGGAHHHKVRIHLESDHHKLRSNTGGSLIHYYSTPDTRPALLSLSYFPLDPLLSAGHEWEPGECDHATYRQSSPTIPRRRSVSNVHGVPSPRYWPLSSTLVVECWVRHFNLSMYF